MNTAIFSTTNYSEIKKQEKEKFENVKNYVQDNTKSLKERWLFFSENKRGETDLWVWHSEALKRFKGHSKNEVEKSLFSKYSKHDIIKTVDMVNRLHDHIGLIFSVDILVNGDKKETFLTVTVEDVENLKKEILTEFIWSFKYEW